MEDYRPARWLPNAHLQTLWGRFARRRPRLPLRHETWAAPDGDRLELYRLDGAADAPRVLLLHGLEGGLHSHYTGGVLAAARSRGWAADMLAFRSCGEEQSTACRLYHSGETGDARFVIERMASDNRPLVVIGVSLGGNVLLKYLGEEGQNARGKIAAAVAISVPFDLARSSRFISQGFSRMYERRFLRSLLEKAAEKSKQYPGKLDSDAVSRAATMWDFDDAVTAPLHGFASAEDYYARSSSLGFLDRIRVPTLLISAVDDPFLPPEVLDEVRTTVAANPDLRTLIVEKGGHVGFVSGTILKHVYYAEESAFRFLESQLEKRTETHG